MENLLEMAQVVMESARWKIMENLQENPKYIGQIAKDLNLDRSNVAYHLSVLEQNGLVNSEYKILVPPHSPGKAARFYSVNKQVYEEFLKEIEKILPKFDKE